MRKKRRNNKPIKYARPVIYPKTYIRIKKNAKKRKQLVMDYLEEEIK